MQKCLKVVYIALDLTRVAVVLYVHVNMSPAGEVDAEMRPSQHCGVNTTASATVVTTHRGSTQYTDVLLLPEIHSSAFSILYE